MRFPLTEVSKMTLEEKLMGKEVLVEAQVYGGSGDQNIQLYFGNYGGTDTLNDDPVLVLNNAHYFTKSGISWLDRIEEQKRRACVSLLAIPTRYILSVGIVDNEESAKYKKKRESE